VLNDVLVPHLKAIFDLNYTRVMLIQFAFFSAYFLFSIPSAKIIDSIGYKKTMVVGLCTMGLGALRFIPAASVRRIRCFSSPHVLAAGHGRCKWQPILTWLSGTSGNRLHRLNLAQAFNSLGQRSRPISGGMLIECDRQNMDAVRQCPRMHCQRTESTKPHR